MEKQSSWYAWRYGKKEETIKEINEPVKKLADVLLAIKTKSKEEDERTPKIQVSEAAGALAFLYEKLRTIIDDKEERLLRKYAIERILKRRLLIEGVNKNVSKALIQELIYARYLPNKAVPEEKIEQVDEIINKYLSLKERAEKLDKNKGGENLDSWLLGLMACEIEIKLRKENTEQALIEFMYSIIKEDLIFYSSTGLSADFLDEKEKKIQLLIACQRALAKADRMVSSYFLWRLYWPDWPKANQALIDEVAANLSLLRETINKHLSYPLQEKIFVILQKEVIIYNILAEIIWNNPAEAKELLARPELLEKEVKKISSQRHKAAKRKLGKAAFRSIIYIFVTKMLLALGLEIPLDFYILKQVNPLAIGINIVFPPLYMFFLALSIRMPLAKNTERIWQGLKGIVYLGEKRLVYKIRPPFQSFLRQVIFTAIYSLITAVIFLVIIWGLFKIGFSMVSTFIFILFLCLVSFFGMRIRRSSRELIIYRQKEPALTSIIDFFFLPIINVGRWLSYKFSKINIFVFFFDFIIEAPLKIFIQVLEEWFSFLREKKEEMY